MSIFNFMDIDMFEINVPHYIDELCVNDFFVLDNFIIQDSFQNIYQQALELYQTNQMQKSGVGESARNQINHGIRGDFVYWINNLETSPVSTYLQKMENLQGELKSNLRMSLKWFESHFAAYPKGSFYLPHYDFHHKSQHRLLSCILYLSDWKKGDGGELTIHQNDNKILIEPIANRFVCFNSKTILHEVLPYQGNLRLSVTGWLRDDPHPV